jgi:glycosyltransferase involved in cell wall biosynthesis
MENVIEMDPITRLERIEAGQKFSKRYSWTKMARETLDLYKTAV